MEIRVWRVLLRTFTLGGLDPQITAVEMADVQRSFAAPDLHGVHRYRRCMGYQEHSTAAAAHPEEHPAGVLHLTL